MPTKPVANSNRDSNAELRLKKVVERVFDLPSFPLVIKKLMEVAEDPNSSSKDLARVMESDQGLSTKILKLVNSAFYSFPNPVSSLQHAVTLVGYNSVRSLAMSVSVKNLFKSSTGCFDQERFWEHCLATALCARYLGAINKLHYRDDLFTAGLLHDMGILLEARYFPEELSLAIEASADRGISLSQAEEEFLGVDHCLLGAWLAEKWRLPPGLREPMLRHHEFEDPNHDELAESDDRDELLMVLNLVTLSNIIARGMGYTNTRLGDNDFTIETSFPIPDHLRPFLQGEPIEAIVGKVQEDFNASRDFLA